MYNIEHIGIAVKSLTDSDILFQRLLGTSSYKHEEVPDQMVITSFFMAGDAKVELLQATGIESPIHKFIERKGEGIHHIAFEVRDIKTEMRRLKEEGFELLQEDPSIGADNKWVCFIHPRSANGVLVELCESVERPTLTDDALDA